jgi:hypothetical protein
MDSVFMQKTQVIGIRTFKNWWIRKFTTIFLYPA